VCFLIVSKHTLSLKIFRNLSIFMQVWILNFQKCYRKKSGRFVMMVCVLLTMSEHITPHLFHVLFCVPCPCINLLEPEFFLILAHPIYKM